MFPSVAESSGLVPTPIWLGLSLLVILWVLSQARRHAVSVGRGRYLAACVGWYAALWGSYTAAVLGARGELALVAAVWPFGLWYGLASLLPSWGSSSLPDRWALYSVPVVGGLLLVLRLGIWLDGRKQLPRRWVALIPASGLAVALVLFLASWSLYSLGRLLGFGAYLE